MFEVKVENMPKGRFRGVSLQKEIIDAVEKYLKSNPDAPYRSVAEFISEAVRRRLEELEKIPPRFEHFNLGEHGVRIIDREINWIVDVYFKPEGIWCDYCQTDNCPHIKYALSIPEIRQIVEKKRKEGWNLPAI